MPVQIPLVGEHRVPRFAGLDLFRVNSDSTIYGTRLYGNVRVVQVIQRSSLAGMPHNMQGVYAFVRSQAAHCRQSLPQVHGTVRSNADRKRRAGLVKPCTTRVGTVKRSERSTRNVRNATCSATVPKSAKKHIGRRTKKLVKLFDVKIVVTPSVYKY